MKRSKYSSFNELPLMLTVQDVADVLGIGLAHAYEVAHRQDFPTITLGSRIIVPRDKFMAWIDEQAAHKTEIFSWLFQRFCGICLCCNKRPQAQCMRATERSEALSES